MTPPTGPRRRTITGEWALIAAGLALFWACVIVLVWAWLG